jgi:hypothetical protein
LQPCPARGHGFEFRGGDVTELGHPLGETLIDFGVSSVERYGWRDCP